MRGIRYTWLLITLLSTSIGCVLHSDSSPGAPDPTIAGPGTCVDQVKNGSETDVDCGGSGLCPACAATKACAVPTDCASQVCTGAICQAPTCSDSARNGSETDTDCGGACGACDLGKQCKGGPDCLTGACVGGRCMAASCTDGVRNYDETDIDCGGSCGQCGVEHGCVKPTDCNTAVCGTNGTCRAVPTCNDIHKASAAITSGTYIIDPGQRPIDEVPMPAYCDMTSDGGGWTMVYKISVGLSGSPPDVWTANKVLNELQSGYATTAKNADFYMNRLGTSKYWQANGIAFTEVRAAVYSGGAEKAFVQFNNITSDRFGWFAQGNVTKSTWTDVATQAYNFFSIAGHPVALRSWFINNQYNGCPGDSGWLKIGYPTDGPCPWDNKYRDASNTVDIIYADYPVNQNWEAGLIGKGETFMVFIR